MTGNDACEIKIDKLENFIKALKKGKLPECKIGILGNKNSRAKSELTNSMVGAKHEFGSAEVPQRSFLRMPLAERLPSEIEKSGAFDNETFKKVVDEKSLKIWMQKIAVIAEGVVQEAFATGGFGKWPAWKNPNYKNNANQLLVDTTQLRDSITSEVKGE